MDNTSEKTGNIPAEILDPELSDFSEECWGTVVEWKRGLQFWEAEMGLAQKPLRRPCRLKSKLKDTVPC